MPESLAYLATLLKSFPVFGNLNEEELMTLASFSSLKIVNKNTVLIEEGKAAKYFYLLVKGSFAVVSSRELTNKIAYDKVYPGEIIGEVPLFYQGTRTASVVAQTPAIVIAIPLQRFKELAKGNWQYTKAMTSIARNMAKRLAASKNTYVRVYKRFHHLNDSMIFNITTISLFIFIVPVIKLLHENFSYHQAINTLFIGILALGALGAAKYAKVAWKDLGFTLENWKSSVFESLFFSFLAFLFLLFLKYLILHFYPNFNLANALQENTQDSNLSLLVAIAIYSLFSVIQEFIARGCLQGPMSMLLMGRYVNVKAIVISNLLFSSFHVVYSYPLAIITFFPGLFWGWLYSRNPSLIGVSISHAILGTLALFIL